jgi:hypothetical protein
MLHSFKKLSFFFQCLLEWKNLEQIFRLAINDNNIEKVQDFIDYHPNFFTHYNTNNNTVPFTFVLCVRSSFEVVDLLIQSHIDQKINLSFDKIKNNNILNYFASSQFPYDREKILMSLLKLPEVKEMVSQTKKNSIFSPSVYEYAVEGNQSIEFFNTLLSIDDSQFLYNQRLVKLVINAGRDDLLSLIIEKNADFLLQNQEEFSKLAIKQPNVKVLELLFELRLPDEKMLNHIQETMNSILVNTSSERFWAKEKKSFLVKTVEKIKIKKECDYLNETVHHENNHNIQTHKQKIHKI